MRDQCDVYFAALFCRRETHLQLECLQNLRKTTTKSQGTRCLKCLDKSVGAEFSTNNRMLQFMRVFLSSSARTLRAVKPNKKKQICVIDFS